MEQRLARHITTEKQKIGDDRQMDLLTVRFIAFNSNSRISNNAHRKESKTFTNWEYLYAMNIVAIIDLTWLYRSWGFSPPTPKSSQYTHAPAQMRLAIQTINRLVGFLCGLLFNAHTKRTIFYFSSNNILFSIVYFETGILPLHGIHFSCGPMSYTLKFYFNKCTLRFVLPVAVLLSHHSIITI